MLLQVTCNISRKRTTCAEYRLRPCLWAKPAMSSMTGVQFPAGSIAHPPFCAMDTVDSFPEGKPVEE